MRGKSGRTVLANSFLPPRSIQSMSLTTRVRRSVWLRLLSVQLQQPSFMDWLIGYGVEQIISTGTCGVLADIEENAFLVPVQALRDEGASYHYVAPSRYMEIQPEAIAVIEQVLEARGILYEEVMTWTTDGFYRETAEKVAYRKGEGCAVVEMECSALAAVAQLRGALWGELLFTADSLADLDQYDSRDWGSEAFEKALELCLEIASKF